MNFLNQTFNLHCRLHCRLHRWLIIAIILLAFGLRAYQLDEQSLRGDEAASATYAGFPVAEIMEISRVADPHPPLFYAALHFWQALTGSAEFGLRFWVLLPGVLAVSSLYALVKRLIGSTEAILAALLLAVNSFHIWHSQDVRSYTWLMLLGIWASYFLWQALQRGRRLDWGGYTLAIAFLFYLHYYSFFILVFHGLYVLCFTALFPLFQAPIQGSRLPVLPPVGGVRGRRMLLWLTSILLASLAFLPWLSTSWQFVSRFTGDFAPAFPHVVLWRGLQAFSGGLVVEPPRFAAWTIAAVLPAGVGAWALWRRQRAAALFLFLYLGVPFAGVMLLSLRGQAFTERYLIEALPPYLALAAAGLSYLLGAWSVECRDSTQPSNLQSIRQAQDKSPISNLQSPISQSIRQAQDKPPISKSPKRRSAVGGRRLFTHWLGLAALLVIIAGNLYTFPLYHVDPTLAKSPQWRQLFEHIFEFQDPAADVLIYNFPEASITYYLDTRLRADQEALPAFLVPGRPNPPAAEAGAQLTELLSAYQRVWFTPVDIAGWDDAKVVETWLSRHADRIDRLRFHWIHADLYLTPVQIERSMTPQPAQFANGVRLKGFRVFNAAPDGQAHLADEPLDLSLYWTAAAPTAVPVTVFVQLIDSRGLLRGGQDNQPVAGSYPTTHWQPNELIVDKYRVSLQPDAPAGAYQVWVGLYNPQTGERIMVVDEAGRSTADHIVLTVAAIK